MNLCCKFTSSVAKDGPSPSELSYGGCSSGLRATAEVKGRCFLCHYCRECRRGLAAEASAQFPECRPAEPRCHPATPASSVPQASSAVITSCGPTQIRGSCTNTNRLGKDEKRGPHHEQPGAALGCSESLWRVNEQLNVACNGSRVGLVCSRANVRRRDDPSKVWTT
ncbi:hypothetical protein SRHO_G00034980 [Serrasalmus rhombeus]